MKLVGPFKSSELSETPLTLAAASHTKRTLPALFGVITVKRVNTTQYQMQN